VADGAGDRRRPVLNGCVPFFDRDRRVPTAAIVAAAGRGQRFGGGRPKQLRTLGGLAILERSVTALLNHPAIDEVVVALPGDVLADPPSYLRAAAKPLKLVAGGERRQDSVANAFAMVSDEAAIIVIHDAARPFVSDELIEQTIAAALESGAAIAAVQARDTVKQAENAIGAAGGEPSNHRFVRQTLARETVYLAQTPQAFRRDVLRDALALAGPGVEVTDEASLAERAGHRVRLVDGDQFNIKVTTPGDMPVAEAIARERAMVVERQSSADLQARQGSARAGTIRIGTGYDLHRLVEGRPLILGGVMVPYERGLLGHSDADAVCHAVTDAVLGAAAAGDIGQHFPDTDARFRGASSIDLLARAAQLVRERGFEIVNVDVVVIAERPKLAPYIDAMRGKVAAALGIPVSGVSVKGKTNEGVGELGRGEAIATHAVALVEQREW
jgi:2-C-methyl-D-erythritol 4-phosphate cytidylyltransferase/2-C-methyl-D-erythritol 2,4-cyclodiphosphate synthase